MGGIGCGCAVIAVVLAVVTAIPFLGWANWIATIPVAVLGIIFSAVGVAGNDRRTLAAIGLAISVIVLFWALFRLALGGGVL